MVERPFVEGGGHPVDWLISQRPEYVGTDLARWAGRYDSKFLVAFSKLRAQFPDHFKIATDYLFDAATFSYPDKVNKIFRKDVHSRTLDRTASMQGGFPWTDDEHPWPTRTNFDGDVEYARPTLQLNMRDIGSALGLPLPNILFQVWDDYHGNRVIELAEIQGRQPAWEMPDIDENFSGFAPEPYGWIYATDQNNPNWSWIGNTVDVGSDRKFILPDMDWCFVDQDYDEPSLWRDVNSWMRSQFGGHDYDTLLQRIMPAVTAEQRAELEEVGTQLVKLNEAERLNASRQRNGRGSFFGEPVYLRGSTPYQSLIMTARKLFYEPAPQASWNEPGLNFYEDYSFMITINDPKGALVVLDRAHEDPRFEEYAGHAEA